MPLIWVHLAQTSLWILEPVTPSLGALPDFLFRLRTPLLPKPGSCEPGCSPELWPFAQIGIDWRGIDSDTKLCGRRNLVGLLAPILSSTENVVCHSTVASRDKAANTDPGARMVQVQTLTLSLTGCVTLEQVTHTLSLPEVSPA